MIAYRAVATAVAAFALALAAGLGWFVASTPGSVFSDERERIVAPATTTGGTVSVTVGSGDTANAIGQALEQGGVVRSQELFEILVGLTGLQDKLQAGDYEFERGMTAIEVVHRIATGKTAQHDVLIPEGRRVEEVGDLLEKAGVVSKADFLRALDKSNYTQAFLAQVDGPGLEGFLFPARYQFAKGTGADAVVGAMLDAFQANVADSPQAQLEGQDLTLVQVVTLASIVEREAVTPSERPIIASVFLNRLRAGIALQTDPTVQYALGSQPASVAQYGYWKQALTLDDLKLDSPYNTYTNPGLPPGPIASPGLDAIQAVIRPSQTDYLYFVATGDGTHAFADTLEEHLRNVQKYQ
jgi:UPF0755 protein